MSAADATPPPAAATMAVTIRDGDGRPFAYLVRPAEPLGDLLAFALTREGEGGPTYRVARDRRGRWRCACEGFLWRGHCKHVRKTRELFDLPEGEIVAKSSKTNDAPASTPARAAAADQPAAPPQAPARDDTPPAAAQQEVIAHHAQPQRQAVMSAAQADLIKRTICVGATDDELRLFLMQCNRTGLDPFSRQIHAVKRWNAKERREVMSIQVGIDGFRLVADRTGETDGQDGPFWCDGKLYPVYDQGGKHVADAPRWLDVWASAEPPHAAKVVVHRRGRSRPFVGIAHWNEYKQEFYDKQSGQWKLTPFWLRMPAGQLAKCAEALALRKAFPAELSGLYAPEEMRDEPKDDEPQPTATVVVGGRHVAGPKPTAAAPPAADAAHEQNGAQQHQAAATKPADPDRERLEADDARLAAEGLSKAGELLAHVREKMRADGLTWAANKAEAQKAAAAFEWRRLYDRVQRLMDAVKWDWPDLLGQLGLPEETTQLNATQLRGGVKALETAKAEAELVQRLRT